MKAYRVRLTEEYAVRVKATDEEDAVERAFEQLNRREGYCCSDVISVNEVREEL